MPIKNAYIGGALTRAETDMRPIYENIAKICQDLEISPYVPHLMGTCPVDHPKVTPEYVWKKDYEAVTSADMIIAYAGQPSLGLGGELEIARMAKKQIILWWFKGEKVSRFPRGNPAVVLQIEAESEKDLLERVKSYFSAK